MTVAMIVSAEVVVDSDVTGGFYIDVPERAVELSEKEVLTPDEMEEYATLMEGVEEAHYKALIEAEVAVEVGGVIYVLPDWQQLVMKRPSKDDPEYMYTVGEYEL
jgi:hypothetical protein